MHERWAWTQAESIRLPRGVSGPASAIIGVDGESWRPGAGRRRFAAEITGIEEPLSWCFRELHFEQLAPMIRRDRVEAEAPRVERLARGVVWPGAVDLLARGVTRARSEPVGIRLIPITRRGAVVAGHAQKIVLLPSRSGAVTAGLGAVTGAATSRFALGSGTTLAEGTAAEAFAAGVAGVRGVGAGCIAADASTGRRVGGGVPEALAAGSCVVRVGGRRKRYAPAPKTMAPTNTPQTRGANASDAPSSPGAAVSCCACGSAVVGPTGSRVAGLLEIGAAGSGATAG